ncbi:MAG: thiosulfate oxidation carrier protein SoxY [Burkholderiales bacterium]
MNRSGLQRRALLAMTAALATGRHAFGQGWRPQVGVDARVGYTAEGVLATILGGASMQEGRVKLDLPARAETGHSVPMTVQVGSPMTVQVDSPMTDADHVKRIDLVSEKNPVPHMGTFFLGPDAGRAEISARVRLNGTQRITAIAQLSDGSFWYDTADIVVHEAACHDGT